MIVGWDDDVIEICIRRMFNQQELQVLVGGVNAPVDLNDLRRNTQYGGLYDDEHQTVQLFWKVLSLCISSRRYVCLMTIGARSSTLSIKNNGANYCVSSRAVVARHSCKLLLCA
jgi:ubiquitin-protein ligase E3 C